MSNDGFTFSKEDIIEATKASSNILNTLNDQQRMELMSDLVLAESGKIIVKSHVALYIDLDLLIDRFLGYIVTGKQIGRAHV